MPCGARLIAALAVAGLVFIAPSIIPAAEAQEQTPSSSSEYPPFNYGPTACYACLPGNYSSSEGSAQCSRCMPGFYNKMPASSMCYPCPPSTFTPFIGATSCLPCKGATGYNYSTCPSTVIRRECLLSVFASAHCRSARASSSSSSFFLSRR